MSNIVISVEKLSKSYRLGVIGSGTFYGDINRWWAKLRGRPDPYQIVDDSDKNYRSGEIIWALQDVNFKVQRGEALGIIGSNGAGKSTLLKILSRVTAPTSGIVNVNGRIASLLEVGTGFHPELTGRENIFLNGAILGMSRKEIEHKFDEIVDFSGVEQFIDTPVKRYSSGMYVRLAFAVAAHLEPEILIVDEVLAVGDAAFQKKCIGKMSDVAHEGRTVLFVSHNSAAIRNLCTSCILFSEGKITMNGPVDAVIKHYLRRDEKSFPSKIMLPELDGKRPGVGRSLQIMSQDGTQKSDFELGERWKVIFEFEMFENTEQISAGFHLVNNESITVMTFISSPKDLNPGFYRVEFDVDEPIASCDLHFSAALWSYDIPIYFQTNIEGVTIHNTAVDTHLRLATSAHGVILTNQNEIIEKIG